MRAPRTGAARASYYRCGGNARHQVQAPTVCDTPRRRYRLARRIVWHTQAQRHPGLDPGGIVIGSKLGEFDHKELRVFISALRQIYAEFSTALIRSTLLSHPSGV